MNRRKRMMLLFGGGRFKAVAPLLYDEFTGIDTTLLSTHIPSPTNTIGASWTSPAGFIINGNQAKWNGAEAHNHAVVNSGLSNLVIEALLTRNTGTTRSAGLVSRYKDSSNYIGLYLYDGTSQTVKIYAVTGGNFGVPPASVGITTLTNGLPHYVSLMTVGNTILGNYDGLLIKALNVTANNTEIGCGLWGFSNYWYDDFRIYTQKSNLLVFDGDSLTLGYGLTILNTYPYKVHANYPESAWTNVGMSGYAFAEANADVATRVNPTFTAGFNNVMVVWYGCNDLRRPGATAQTTYDNLVAYVAARRTAGANKVVGCTLLPAGDADAITQDFETRRQAFNALLRANHAFLDGLADVAADARIGGAGAEQDTDYFQDDKIHPTAAGTTIIADIISTKIRTLLI